MNENNSLKEIGEQLLDAKRIALFPHIQMDGDAFGAASGLCRALRNSGREAVILLEDKIPDYLQFLDYGYCTMEQEQMEAPDVCICIDCGETKRFPKRAETFFHGKKTICVDHHASSQPFADYNYIDPGVAATAEIVYRLIKEMNLEVDRETGEALFTGICTDTGNFQYSNTTKESHLITADLYDAGIDHTKIAVELYQNISLNKIRITNRILDTLELFAGGRAAMVYVTQDMVQAENVSMEETEGSVDTVRNIRGVEIAVFIKERQPGLVKASMRAKTCGNVGEIAAAFGGGGHVKAAGCTLEMDIRQACETLKKAVEAHMQKIEGTAEGAQTGRAGGR
ncbi:MAG: bifunctional oligoribonuclease/PAP phosphatase NrnA [Firmicutes bacterium]|nr:bifunctional oligoribonuclease/PAP phosphatase NrnA [Bacillota bacterium]